RPHHCAIYLAEAYAGVRPGEQAVTEAFFSARGDIPIDAAIGRRAGSYLARFSRSHGVEIADALIAAVAASARLPLWTLNRRHYPMPDVTFFEPDDSTTAARLHAGSPGGGRHARAVPGGKSVFQRGRRQDV